MDQSALELTEEAMKFDINQWNCPDRKYRVKPIIHHFADDYMRHLDAVEAFGYGGVVTNPDRDAPNDHYREDCKKLGEITDELKRRNLGYFLYDEKGFPSGVAGGMSTAGHPELMAKGLYMHRHMAYAAEHFTYHIDDDSDKIVWAMKIPVRLRWDSAFPVRALDEDAAEAVPFTERSLETDLLKDDVLFIFAVRTAQEGSQIANTPAVGPYINIMDEKAVRRFIDLFYEPIAEEAPEAFPGAEAVFTDEPSLMVRHMTPFVQWSFALAPWVDGLFEEYELEYGTRLEPVLHHLFEGDTSAAPERIRFYQLVGKLIGRNYTGQLNRWCRDHGTIISGHYLGEENILGNVLDYGSYIETLRCAGLPGMDILECYPEIYNYNAAKHPQMAVRKNNVPGMMVELCPVVNIPTFMEHHLDNMCAIIGLLFLGGVRKVNSYYFNNFEEYDPVKLKGENGPLNEQEANWFNEYVGRISHMLDGCVNDCSTFVYYGIEDTQGKLIPSYTMGDFTGDTDNAVQPLVKKIYESGHDFYYADMEDLTEAAKAEFPAISGHPVTTVILPAMDILYDESYEALKKLKDRGVRVLFQDKVPMLGTERPVDRKESRKDFAAVSDEEILAWLDLCDSTFTAKSDNAAIIKGRFEKEGRELWMILNNTREDRDVLLQHETKKNAMLYDPSTGEISEITMGEKICIPWFRSVFVWF